MNNNFIYGYDINKKIKSKIENNIKDTEPNLNDLIKKNKKFYFY